MCIHSVAQHMIALFVSQMKQRRKVLECVLSILPVFTHQLFIRTLWGYYLHIFMWRSWGTQRLRNLPVVIQLESGGFWWELGSLAPEFKLPGPALQLLLEESCNPETIFHGVVPFAPPVKPTSSYVSKRKENICPHTHTQKLLQECSFL